MNDQSNLYNDPTNSISHNFASSTSYPNNNKPATGSTNNLANTANKPKAANEQQVDNNQQVVPPYNEETIHKVSHCDLKLELEVNVIVLFFC